MKIGTIKYILYCGNRIQHLFVLRNCIRNRLRKLRIFHINCRNFGALHPSQSNLGI